MQLLFNRRMLICVFTGFSSGMPLYLLLSLLPAWFQSEGINLHTIGAFALIQIPYTWKFLWAPLLERYHILPWLGRRRGWMLLSQLGLLAAISWLGQLSPTQQMGMVVMVAVVLAFLSATQDIVLDAFRREILPDIELGLGNAIHINAYRIAGLIPGSLSLILADRLPWPQVFLLTALFMLPGVLMTLSVKEPRFATTRVRTLSQAVIEPFREFFGRHGVRPALLILAFLVLYKLGDSMSTHLATPFYMQMGYTKTQIGLIAKNAGLWPAIAGATLGGIWMLKLGLNRALWIFGFIQMVTTLGFVCMAQLGPAETGQASLTVLTLVIAAEASASGLGTTALITFIARTTHPAYTATQFALFTSLTATPRTFINASAGWLVEQFGWVQFFWLCLILAIPGLILLRSIAPWHGEHSAPSISNPSSGAS